MRSAQDTGGSGGTATPIYDALYSEYRRLFRTLPGDRTGEEALLFDGFGIASWRDDYPPPAAGRHRGNGPAALPPGRQEPRAEPRGESQAERRAEARAAESRDDNRRHDR